MVRLLPLAFFACTAPDGEDTAPLPSKYVVEDTGGDDTPQISADAAAAAVNAVFEDAFHFNSNPIFLGYNEVMAYGDDTCPGNTSAEPGGWFWDVNCTASSGAGFTGFMSEYEGVDSGTGADVRRMRGESTVTLPDGKQLVVAGDASSEVRMEGNPSWSSEVAGVMAYDGPAADGTWMQDGVDVNLSYEVDGKPEGGVLRVYLDGSVSGLEGDVSAVAFREVHAAASDDYPCAAEPEGDLALRDANGVWADLLFDVEDDGEGGYTIDDGECDGCGTLWFQGEVLGEVCVDTNLLLGAATPPW